MSTVIGLDLSLVRSGAACWRNGHIGGSHVGHGSVNAKNDAQRIRRVTSQARSVLDLVDGERADGIDLIAIERYLIHGRGGASEVDIHQLHGFVLDHIVAWKIPFAYVHNQVLKQFATGKARADKPEMMAAAKPFCRPRNHDEADAVWLAAMGAVHLGDYPPFALTHWRLSNLDKVEWPVAA